MIAILNNYLDDIRMFFNVKVNRDIPTYLDFLHCEEKMSCIPKFIYTSKYLKERIISNNQY